ncbi:hypothetical protein VMCG_08924 [Cytospora schulzeri]|uniref:Uncharacterized protein n=1 Tax=Cytospora schulzeri TaxID=448051 RepID=A0A423VNL6_9PEZI|nr:hypothetical protein VMCG_08924 [Valsa malicola]
MSRFITAMAGRSSPDFMEEYVRSQLPPRYRDSSLLFPDTARITKSTTTKRRKKPGPKKGRKRQAANKPECECIQAAAHGWPYERLKCPMPSLDPPDLCISGVDRTDTMEDGSTVDCTAEDLAWVTAQGDGYEVEPKEKAVDYGGLLAKVEHDLDWYGKWDALSDVRMRTLGADIAIRIEKTLKRLLGYLEKPKGCRSFGNRVHVLTVMSAIIDAVVSTNGRIGCECRKWGFEYDDVFLWAVEKLSEGQRRRLRVLDRGEWVASLVDTIEAARSYCVFDKLKDALALIDPDAAAASKSTEGGGDSEGVAQ